MVGIINTVIHQATTSSSIDSSNLILIHQIPLRPLNITISTPSTMPQSTSKPSLSKSFQSIYQTEAPNMTTNPSFPFATPTTPGDPSNKSPSSRTTYTAPPAYTSSNKSPHVSSDTASIASTSSAKTLIGKVFGRKCKLIIPIMSGLIQWFSELIHLVASESSKSSTRSEKDIEVAENEAKHAARASYFSTL